MLPKIFARKVFIVGLCAACLFWFWSSLYIWEIRIDGNIAITDEVFTDFLKENGVYVGVRSGSVDIEQLEKDIRREFGEITWTSVKLSGTSLIISVKESDAILSPVQEDITSDLYAEKEGVIVSMIVRSGVPMVKIGDSVEMGTLLVSGRVPVYNEDATIRHYQYTRSDADIYVERIRPVYEVLPFYYIEKVYTGREVKKYYITVGGKDIIFGGAPHFTYYDTVIQTQKISPLEGLTLPFSFGTYTYREYQNTERAYTLEEAEELLKEKYLIFLSDLEEKGVQIIEKNVKIDTGSGIWILEGELTVREKIGAELPFTETEGEPPAQTTESE